MNSDNVQKLDLAKKYMKEDPTKLNTKRQPSAEKIYDSKRTNVAEAIKISERENKQQRTSTERSTEVNALPRETLTIMDPKPLPDRLKRIYGQRDSRNCSEKQKKAARKRKQRFANQVGWQKRQGRHRHQHQADRERRLVNYMNGLPLDYNEDDGY